MNESKPIPQNTHHQLLNDIRSLIIEAKQSVATAVNAAMSLLYWRIGKRLNDEVLHGKRAEFGSTKIIAGAIAGGTWQ